MACRWPRRRKLDDLRMFLKKDNNLCKHILKYIHLYQKKQTKQNSIKDNFPRIHPNNTVPNTNNSHNVYIPYKQKGT